MTTIGHVLVSEILPPKYRDETRTLGSKELEALLAQIAKEDPDLYKDISAKLMRLGNQAAYESGTTLRLSDILPPFDRSIVLNQLNQEEEKIRANPKLTEEQKTSLITDLYDKVQSLVKQQTYETSLAVRNPFAMQVKSKARGNQDQLAAMISTPGTYSDSRGNTVPLFIQHSFADGLTPAEYWAGTFGGRLGILSSKFSTRKGGYLGKLLSQATVDQVVTEDDCGGAYGMPVKADDTDNIGAVLQQDAGGVEAGTVVTKEVLADLKKQNIDTIIVRSPITCACKDGICSKCCGIRETGNFPPIGYNLGLNASSALAERITQGALNCLAEGTLVRMADGSVKPIEQITAGEMVLGSDMLGNISPTRVVANYDNGIQPCIRTRFIENGTQKATNPGILLDSTAIHPILGTRFVSGQLEEKLNWVPRMLEVGRKSRHFYGYTISSFDDTGLVSEPLAMLLGALLGDGCYTDSVNGVHISCADPSEIHDLEQTLQGYDLKLQRLKYHNGIYYRVSQHSPKGGKNVVKNYLKKHGMYGKLAHEKEIPAVVHTWDNQSIGCFIGGLIATDGSVYSSDGKGKPGISFASTSRRLVEQFKELVLLRFGILGSAVTKTGKPGTYCRVHEQWQYTITKPAEVRRLSKNITIPGVKRGKLEKLLSEYHGSSGNEYRVAFKRVSQEDIGLHHVYDLEVECPDHIYLLANGLIVHNTKHTGKKAKGKSSYSGFEAIKNMTTVPGTYPDAAVVAEEDGKVDAIEAAPQGGSYVFVDGHRHYVAPGYDILVKPGDTVEAGDQLSDGVINPVDIVKYKGIGEGRRYFATRLTQMMRDSNYAVNRRNVEAIARSLVNHVQIDDEDAEAQLLPGDIATYTSWSFGYRPRENTKIQAPSQSIGQYLESPILHYTIGTKITKKTAEDMAKYGIKSIFANPNPVGVTPVMQSVVKSTGTSDDWMARLGTTYLKTRLTEDAQRGSVSRLHSTNPIPGVAKGVEFGNYFEPGVKRPGGYTY